MKAYHVLSMAGVLALSGVLVAQVTTSGGTTQTSSSSSSSSNKSGQSSSSGQVSGGGNMTGMIDLNGKKVFAVLCEPGENWQQNQPVGEQNLDAHVAYLEKLKESNVLVMAGPFMDNSGGEYVIVAKDLKEAEAIVSQDPGYQSKVLAPSVHEWYVAVKSPHMLMALMGGGNGSASGQGTLSPLPGFGNAGTGGNGGGNGGVRTGSSGGK